MNNLKELLKKKKTHKTQVHPLTRILMKEGEVSFFKK